MSRAKLVLLADVVFGVLLLGIAFAGSLRAALPSSAPAHAPGPPELVEQFGGVMPPGQSTGFAVAPDGTLAIVDRGRKSIVRLDANGRPRSDWSVPGAIDLVGIAPDADGWYVLDRGALHILRLDAHGQVQPDRTIDLSKQETYGPNGLASDSHGNLYLADTGRDRLLMFNSSGALVATIGDSGTDLGKFKQPMFLAFAPDGSFYVSDWENSRIQRFNADRQATSAWPVPPHPWGIAVDALGRVYVPDADRRIVRMYAPDGSLLAQIGVDPAAPMPVDGISQVGVSPDGNRLWVLGNDGLALVDLTPYAGLRPSGAEPVRAPLAILGALLLVVAGVGTLRLRPRRSLLTRPTLEPRRFAIPALGPILLGVGVVGAAVVGATLQTDAAKAAPWPRMAALAAFSLMFGAGAVMTRPWRWVRDWPCQTSSCARKRDSRRLPFIPRRWLLHPFAPNEKGIFSEEKQTSSGGLFLVPPILILTGVAAWVWSRGGFQTLDSTRAVLVWLAAVLLVAAALVLNAKPRRSAWALVPLALFAIALLPRAWNNANLPYGVWFDEAEAGLQARKFLQLGLYTPITDTYGRDASLFYYAISAAQALIPDPVEAGRLVAAIVGAACAPLVYFLGRELFGWPVGLIAGLVLASQRWQLDVSRLGWDPISLPFFAILTFWLLARAVRTRAWRDFVWAGLAIGIGMHGYIGYRSLPIVALILLVYAGFRFNWRPVVFVGRVGVTFAAAVLTALPVLIFAVQEPEAFNGRFRQTLVLVEPVSQQQKLEELWSNLQKHVLMFHVSGDMNGRHNLPGAPMLDPISGVLMMLGLAVCVVRPFDWRSWLVFGWGAASLAGGIFTIPYEAPQAMRTLGTTPLLALLVALGLVLVLDRVSAYLPRFGARSALAAGGLAAAIVGFVNVSMFFGQQMNDPTVWESFSTRETLPSRAALAAPGPYEAILGSQTIAPSLQQELMVPTIQNTIRTFDPTTDLPYRGSGPGLIVLESQYDTGLADEVSRLYPDASRTPVLAPSATRPTAYEFVLDPSVVAAHRGLAASRQTDGSWRAYLTVDVGGGYTFDVSDGTVMTLDGAPISSGETVQLVRGNHLVTLAGGTDIRWQPPGASSFAPIEDARWFAAPPGGNGLLATFYPRSDFEGSPTESLIDPVLAHYYHLSPLSALNLSPPTWSAEWLGELEVPTTGTYRFEADRLSRAGLWLDDQLVFDDTPDGAPERQAGSIALTQGRHAIRVRMQNRGDGGPRLYLYWSPPGSTRELVPGSALYPPPPS